MKNLLGIFVATLCLSWIPTHAHAAKTAKASNATKAAYSAKEKLVLMPLRVPEEDKTLEGAMETALVEGLQQKYEVLSGEQVSKKAREIFMKESRNTAKRECDETRCMQGIAEYFQSELIATANVAKREDGYFLALSIRNIFDNLVVYSKSIPCQNCNAYQVVEKLKELSGAPAPASLPAAGNIELTVAGGKTADPESALWEEVKKTNTLDDYSVYLAQYPNGKFAALAKSRINKVKEEAATEDGRKELQAWQSAELAGSEASYQGYLNGYPHGKYTGLAEARIRKLQTDLATREELELWQKALSGENAQSMQDYLDKYPKGSHISAAREKLAAFRKAEAEIKPSEMFKDCPDCPELIILPTGSFDMGSNKGGDEAPAHRVTFVKPFAIGKTEITQDQWKAVMGSNPSGFSSCGNNCPVENVSWNDAKEFIRKLNQKTGKQYSLPTEAQWEYACRARGQHEYCGSNDIGSVAWYGAYANPAGNSGKATNPVATKRANAFGIHDMSGNVWEWTEDSYHANYTGAPTDGTAWSGAGAKRVLRGGSWNHDASSTRSANRFSSEPGARLGSIGIRVTRTLP